MKKNTAFVVALKASENDPELRKNLCHYFLDQLNEALSTGRICTNERMALIYPIVREINEEQQEIEREWKQVSQQEEELCLIS